ncbi:MAG: molecular chaperone [Gammaproteobacteria bacterium]|nr:molecular chaperone [Gammaproteobacteria bacterium]
MYKTFTLTLLLLVNSSVFAGAIEIQPVTLELSNAHPITSVAMKNLSPYPVLFQLYTKKWTQNKRGKDVYTATQDLFFTPPIYHLAPNQQQIIRLGLLKPNKTTKEQAYRLYFYQVNTWKNKPHPKGKFVLHIIYKINIPVFVKTPAALKPDVKWQLKLLRDHKLALVVHNLGNKHLYFYKIGLKSDKMAKPVMIQNTKLMYILAGNTRHWMLQEPKSIKGSHKLSAVAYTNLGTLTATCLYANEKTSKNRANER